MTVKDFCYFTGANLKTTYRKIAKYKDNELRGHITKRKGHGLELDDYAVDFLTPDSLKASEYLNECKKAAESNEKMSAKIKDLENKNTDLLEEIEDLKHRSKELYNELNSEKGYRDMLISERDTLLSVYESEKAARSELEGKYREKDAELIRIISEKDAEILRITKENCEKISEINTEKQELQGYLDAIPERIRNKYINKKYGGIL